MCAQYYAPTVGRPSLASGRYCGLLLVRYFEHRDSERAIVSRSADSFALRHLPGFQLPEAPPDHSNDVAQRGWLIALETHCAVFMWILQRLAGAGLVKGQTIGILSAC